MIHWYCPIATVRTENVDMDEVTELWVSSGFVEGKVFFLFCVAFLVFRSSAKSVRPRPVPPEWERNFFADQTFASSGEFTEAPTCQMKQIQCIPPLKCSL